MQNPHTIMTINMCTWCTLHHWIELALAVNDLRMRIKRKHTTALWLPMHAHALNRERARQGSRVRTCACIALRNAAQLVTGNFGWAGLPSAKNHFIFDFRSLAHLDVPLLRIQMWRGRCLPRLRMSCGFLEPFLVELQDELAAKGRATVLLSSNAIVWKRQTKELHDHLAMSGLSPDLNGDLWLDVDSISSKHGRLIITRYIKMRARPRA